jgi:LytS/YehU family sensor histidine kinase
VLDSKDKEVVTIEDELKFLKSYVYLQQIRFGEKLKVQLSVDHVRGFVAPLALQMLVENAIKHNIISEEQPLQIRVYQSDTFVVVENTLQRKNLLPEESAGLGLENIRRRYEFLKDSKVEVLETRDLFTVKLPLIAIE